MGFFSCRRAARRRPRRCGSPRGLRGFLGFSPGNDVANLDQDAGGANAASCTKLWSSRHCTIPISQSTPKTELLLGGRSEEFRVGNKAEASSQLVWDVEGGLHPEERPRVGLWLSEQFLLSADIFLQSFSSTPTVRPRQHVAIGLGNAVRELASPCTGLGPMVKCPTAALRRRRYGARTDQQPPALLRGSRQGQLWRVRLLQRATDSAGLPDPNAKSANGKATIIIAPNILICHLPFMQELPA